MHKGIVKSEGQRRNIFLTKISALLYCWTAITIIFLGKFIITFVVKITLLTTNYFFDIQHLLPSL